MNNVILYIAIVLGDGDNTFLSMSERWETEFDDEVACYEFVDTGEPITAMIEKYGDQWPIISSVTYLCAPRKPERLWQ